MSDQFILRHIYNVSPDRLQRAVCGLAAGSYHVYVTQQDSEHVAGSVINGDGKEYGVSIGDGYVSCACPDFGYRKVAACKHLLSFALIILQTEEGVVEEEPEERPANLKLGKARTSDELARDRAPRRLPALSYDELPY
jgi:hypothetical protein